MSEVNAAYNAIKNGEANYQQQQSSGSYSQYGSYGSDYQDFGPFSSFYDFTGFGRRQQQSRARSTTDMDSVRTYISAGHYQEALYVLSTINTHSAEWFYYSALANYGLNNRVTALEHAQKAVSMDPGNSAYQDLLSSIQNNQRVYRSRNAQFGMPYGNTSRICISIILMNLLCSLFGGSGITCLPCYLFW